MGTLTVRENLNFSAALRLPTYVSQKEKQQKVNKLIEELGLARVADSRVRTLENKGTKHKAPSETDNKIYFPYPHWTVIAQQFCHIFMISFHRINESLVYLLHSATYYIHKIHLHNKSAAIRAGTVRD